MSVVAGSGSDPAGRVAYVKTVHAAQPPAADAAVISHEAPPHPHPAAAAAAAGVSDEAGRRQLIVSADINTTQVLYCNCSRYYTLTDPCTVLYLLQVILYSNCSRYYTLTAPGSNCCRYYTLTAPGTNCSRYYTLTAPGTVLYLLQILYSNCTQVLYTIL